MVTRFVYGPHIHRDDQPVVEVYDGDKFIAAIYTGDSAIKIVSRHFAADTTTLDQSFPPVLSVRFTGAEPPGRDRLALGNGPGRGRFE